MFGSYSLNWLGIIVAALASFLVGMVWYSKPVFGKAWAKLSGINDKKMNKERGRTIITSILLSLISSFVLANFITWLSVEDSVSALRLALWLWLGFFVPTEATKVLWERRSWNLYFLNICYQLAALSVAAVLLAAWH